MSDKNDYIEDEGNLIEDFNEESSQDAEEEKNENENKKTSVSKVVFEWVQTMINAIVIVVLLLTFVFRLINVEGKSMLDTLQNGDKVVVTSFNSNYRYGDIIIISKGEKLEKVLVKRVIATEGQIVDIDTETGNVIVDNVVLPESSYTKDGVGTYNLYDVEFPVTVPEGKLFVLGDNRAVSKDSRSSEVGFIDIDNVIGKAQYIIFPFNHIKKLS